MGHKRNSDLQPLWQRKMQAGEENLAKEAPLKGKGSEASGERKN